MLGWRHDREESLPYAPDKARTALAEAGWVDSDADGWLDKAGERFEFTVLTNTGNTLRSDVGVIIQAQLAEVGVKVNIATLERSTQIKQLRAGNFDAYLGGWSTSMLIDLTPIFHSSATSLFNFGHYSNSEVDRLIELGRQEIDPVKARSIWRETEGHIYRDQPYTFLFWKDRVVGVHARFQDVTPVPLSAVYGLENWFQSKQAY
jgi:peptide/nickel transport system substrate-binding protein